jgi:hypothetical protein
MTTERVRSVGGYLMRLFGGVAPAVGAVMLKRSGGVSRVGGMATTSRGTR